jgi:dTDP-4-dehydrorhamnose reductase
MIMLMNTNLQLSRPELWGGIECTINRIGNQFRDQLLYAGHYQRGFDIDLIAELNISTLRYPVLWERHEHGENGFIDFRWVERRLNMIREKQITPVAGLLHHGSGPRFTDLLDPRFPEKFARYAGAVARKFPWITKYTPINEPLTTARFSALYGHWYPHRHNPVDFVRALINQLKATVLAMREIRTVNTDALLVQTEDLAKIHSTDVLRYQAEFENNRRWLTFDLLSGHVTQSHPLWNYLLSVNIRQHELEFFIENACPPDLLGLNYYVTSERYLDDDIDKYGLHLRGGNGVHEYADTEAVRVGRASGISNLLQETWDRYHRPMAMTEVHIGCTADEQVRWFMEIWNACCDCRSRSIPLEAVTAWSLLGAFDWDSLLTKQDLHYECGAFDVRDGNINLTEFGKVLSTLAATGDLDHPVLTTKGWWQEKKEEIGIF